MMKSLVGEYSLLLVFILTAIIPDVIKRFEPVAGIGMILLHYLVGYSANLGKSCYFSNSRMLCADLTTECADQMVGKGKKVYVLDDAPQGAVRVSRTHSRTSGNVLIPQELYVGILLPTLAKDTWLVRCHVHPNFHIRICQLLLPEPFQHVSHVLLHRVKSCLSPDLSTQILKFTFIPIHPVM